MENKVQQNTIEVTCLEDMANYFQSVRNFFITKAPALWFDNFFVNAILVRAYQLNKGFLELVNNGNFLCAAPLVRMQLETLCRCFGGLIADGDSYIPRFMYGKKVDNQTYNGKQLTYNYLVELLANSFGASELPRIYADGNKFIHPTDIAFKASVWNEGRKVTIQNLEGKLYEEEEMEALKADMFYVNYCYTRVLYQYQIEFMNNVKMADEGKESATPVTDPEEIDKFKDKIEGFLDSIKRDSGSNEEAPDNTQNA